MARTWKTAATLTIAGAQYLLPDGLGPEQLKELLDGQVGALEQGHPLRLDRTFLDTFDGRLHEAGLALVHSAGSLSVVDLPGYGELATAALEPLPATLFANDLPPGRLHDIVAPLVEVRALTAIARTRSRMVPVRVLDGEAKTVARLIFETAVAQGPSRTRIPLAGRLHVVPLRGYAKAAGRVQRAVEGELGLARAAMPLHDDAVAAAGGTPGGVSSAVRLNIRSDTRADAAASIALIQLAGVIEANLPGALADVDSEFLHDLRVAVRRSRSIQRELKRAFPPEPLAEFRREFRWLQEITGPVRDLDVHLFDLTDLRSALPASRQADLDPLEEVLAAHRRRERRRMVRALRSSRARVLLEEWPAFLEVLVSAPDEGRPDAGRPIGEVAAARIRAVYGRMVKMGNAVDDESPAAALHELRKVGKELRYLLEFFGDLYPSDVVRPMVKTLKALQDTLGAHNDGEVQAHMLRDCRDEVGARAGGAAALMAMGLLTDRLERKQADGRARFADRFADFAARTQRDLVKTAFR